MRHPHRGRAAAVLAMACLGLAACSSSSPALTTGGTPSRHPTPTKSGPQLVKAGPSCRAHIGTPVTLRDPANHVVVTIAVKKVKTYTGRLANYSTAHAPANGYFVKFPMKLTDMGPGTWRIDPTWFVLNAGGRSLTDNDGNGPYSGVSPVLSPTFLDPGESDVTNLVIDSPSAHGNLTYEPKGKLACTWSF